jgi:hypothetical protein
MLPMKMLVGVVFATAMVCIGVTAWWLLVMRRHSRQD